MPTILLITDCTSHAILTILPIGFCLTFLNPCVSDCIPSRRAMLLQIRVAMKAMPWYSLFITISEHMVESGWTRCFPQISDIGLQAYVGYLLIYLLIVEFGIYWMHRELHDIKPLYKYLHATHHIYNKENTLSPFAGESCLFPISFICASFCFVALLLSNSRGQGNSFCSPFSAW